MTKVNFAPAALEIAENLASLVKSTVNAKSGNYKYYGEYRIVTPVGTITVIGDSRTLRLNANLDLGDALGDDFHNKWHDLTNADALDIGNLYNTLPELVSLRLANKL
jgi:hypothetical protein